MPCFADEATDQAFELVKLALTHATQGKVREAILAARGALAAGASHPPLLSNLGSIFSLCQSFYEARDCFSRAVSAQKENAAYWYGLATAQRALGHLDEAEASCNEASRLNPQHAEAYWLRSGLRKQTNSDNHVPALEAALAAGYARGQSEVLLRYALAKELEDLGEYARSFEHLRVGARTYRGLLNYDVARDIQTLNCLTASQGPEEIRSAGPGYTGAAPIFVVGLPRSGTTLVERIIQSHTAVVSVGERNDLALELMRLAKAASAGARLNREQLVKRSLSLDMQALGRRYAESINPDHSHGRRTLDKMPINYLYCGLIHAALPEARIVCLRRGSMDSCYAAYKAFLTGPYGFSYDLDELGRYYLAFDELVAHWRAVLPAHVYTEVYYESLVSDPRATARKLIAFLDLPWEPQIDDFFMSAVPSATPSAPQVRQPVYASSIGKWRHYRQQLTPLAARLKPVLPLDFCAEK